MRLLNEIKYVFTKDRFLKFLDSIKFKFININKLIKNPDQINNTIFIYTMGKVGSAAVFQTIRHKLPFASIYHINFLSQINIENRQKFKSSYLSSYYDIKARKIFNKNKNNIKFITLVRDPIARAISDLFQNFDIFSGGKKLKILP